MKFTIDHLSKKFDNKEVELISHDYTSDKVLINNKYIDLIYDEKDTSKYYLEFNIEKEGEK